MGLTARGPEPTAPPAAELVLRALRARQVSDQLCGYVGGDILDPITCQGEYVCAANTFNHARGCCLTPLSDCSIPTACVPSTALSLSCDENCKANGLIKKCSDSLGGECYTKYYASGLLSEYETEVGCTAATSITILAALTYNEPTSSIDFSSLLASYGSLASHLSFTMPSLTSPTTKPTSHSTASSSSHSSTHSGIVSPAKTSAAVHSEDKGGLSSGATIGIAVCATVVGLAIIALIVFLVWWRRRKNAAASSQSYQNPPMQHHPDVTTAFPNSNDAFHPNNFQAFDSNFSQMDDDAVAKMRRFSNEGTVDMTVAGRTNDEYRPQAA